MNPFNHKKFLDPSKRLVPRIRAVSTGATPGVSLSHATLVIGSAYAGKTDFAESLLDQELGATIFGTAATVDPEIEARLMSLKAGRSPSWRIIDDKESILDLPNRLDAIVKERPESAILIDSVNQWLAGLMIEYSQKYNPNQMHYPLADQTQSLIDVVTRILAIGTPRLIIVTSEVGAGTTPPFALERLFRQSLGRLNMRLAQILPQVVLLSAGLPLVMKTATE